MTIIVKEGLSFDGPVQDAPIVAGPVSEGVTQTSPMRPMPGRRLLFDNTTAFVVAMTSGSSSGLMSGGLFAKLKWWQKRPAPVVGGGIGPGGKFRRLLWMRRELMKTIKEIEDALAPDPMPVITIGGGGPSGVTVGMLRANLAHLKKVLNDVEILWDAPREPPDDIEETVFDEGLAAMDAADTNLGAIGR